MDDFMFPYTDFHELNLDWLLDQITQMQAAIADLTARVEALEQQNNTP